jgi:nicotinamidase-related amidase
MRMGSDGEVDVGSYLTTFGRRESELLPAGSFGFEGMFAGEREFVAFADRDYRVDKHWVFEIRREECALLVVDLQNDFVDPASPMCVPEAYRQLPRVRALIEACRRLDVPVVYTAHNLAPDVAGDFPELFEPIAAGALAEGSIGADVHPAIQPAPGERVIRVKHSYDAFAGTDLDYVLRARGVRTVIVCGTLTNFCCESTARSAFSHVYHVVFGSDVTASDSAIGHEATLRTIRCGFGRVLDHATIVRVLESGDDLFAEARAARSPARSAMTPAG